MVSAWPFKGGGEMAEPERAAADPVKKKPYQAPVLEEWGTLLELTRKLGSHGGKDGGKSKQQNSTRP
jgi:hypothetical protein